MTTTKTTPKEAPAKTIQLVQNIQITADQGVVLLRDGSEVEVGTAKGQVHPSCSSTSLCWTSTRAQPESHPRALRVPRVLWRIHPIDGLKHFLETVCLASAGRGERHRG